MQTSKLVSKRLDLLSGSTIRTGWQALFSTGALELSSSSPGQFLQADAIDTNLHRMTIQDTKHAAMVNAALNIPVELHPSPYKASPSEIQSALELFRLHNSSMKVSGGHLIKARVLEVDKKKVTLATGIKTAKIAVSDITPECIVEKAEIHGNTQREPGQILPGDIVQVYLEHEETPEGNMLVSGQHAAVKRRVRAVWKELQDRLKDGQMVKGRILNSVAGGFAVGIGGLVCFLPASACTRATARRIGELQDFRVVQMNPARNNVVLSDGRLRHRHEGDGGSRASFQRKKKQGSWQRQVEERTVVKEAAGLELELARKEDQSNKPVPDIAVSVRPSPTSSV